MTAASAERISWEFVMRLGPTPADSSSRAFLHPVADRDGDSRFRATFFGAAIGIGICTLDGHILEVNPTLAHMLGYGRQELVGIHVSRFHPGDFQRDQTLLAELTQGKRELFRIEKRYQRKDGSHFWGHLSVSMVHDTEGGPNFLVAMVEDITERKQAAEQILESEKMEVIGRLAGGIAHDFNNLLTGILLYCDLLASDLKSSGPRKLVEEIRMAGEHGTALTQQLLAIARKELPRRREMAVSSVITGTQNLLRRLIGEHIELVTKFCRQPAIVFADPAQIRQVLLNLVLNARDAMPEGGRIQISTHRRRMPASRTSAVSIAVSDTGCGMDEATRARLFEPFFTTKKAGEGTGLGLSTVHRIVTESGGIIAVQSVPGQGTLVEVLLPAVTSGPIRKTKAAVRPQQPREVQRAGH